MNALRFVPSGAAKDAARELHEPVGLPLQQQLQRMTLSDAMQPLDDVCYSDDKTMVGQLPPPPSPLLTRRSSLLLRCTPRCLIEPPRCLAKTLTKSQSSKSTNVLSLVNNLHL
jgi:hypothetical protein